VAAPLPPGSPAAGLAAPNEKLSGAAPVVELGAEVPRPGAGPVAAGAASAPAATASSPLNCLRWCHHAGRHIGRWWQAHSGHSRWLPGHEHLLQLTRRQRQSWRRPSWCQKKRSAALTSCPSQLRQAAGCWPRLSRRPQHPAGLRWLAFHPPVQMQLANISACHPDFALTTAVIILAWSMRNLGGLCAKREGQRRWRQCWCR
jgi:hypothetical protein